MNFYPATPAQQIEWPPGAIEDTPGGQRVTVSPQTIAGFTCPPIPAADIPDTPYSVTPPYVMPNGKIAQGFVYYMMYFWYGYNLFEEISYPVSLPGSFYDATIRATMGYNYGTMTGSGGPKEAFYITSPGTMWTTLIADYGAYTLSWENTAWTCTHSVLTAYIDMNGDNILDDVNYYQGYSYQWQEYHMVWGYHDPVPGSGAKPISILPLFAPLVLLMLPMLAASAGGIVSGSSSGGSSGAAAGRRRKKA